MAQRQADFWIGPAALLFGVLAGGWALGAPSGVGATDAVEATAGAGAVRVSRDRVAIGAGYQKDTQVEPHAAADPGNSRRLLVAYQNGRAETLGADSIVVARSPDSGKSWSEKALPRLTRRTSGGWDKASDPWVAFGLKGEALVSSIVFDSAVGGRSGVAVSVSRDHGRTFRPPVVVVESNDGTFHDKSSLVVDAGTASPHRGRIYLFWTAISGGEMVPYVSWSGDGGATFSPPLAFLKKRPAWGFVGAVAKDGTVHVCWTGFPPTGNPQLECARSKGGGAKWAVSSHPTPMNGCGPAGLRSGVAVLSLAIDPRRKALLVAWSGRPAGASRTCRVLLTRSLDGGESWSPPRVVSDGPADAPAFTPAVAVDPSGRIGVAYYSLRNDPSREFLVDEYLALSRDGGLLFDASQRLSPTSWPAQWAARADGLAFLGDYQGLVANHDGFRPFWVATWAASAVTAEPQPDVWTSDAPR